MIRGSSVERRNDVNPRLRLHRPSPAVVLSTIALFFAIGGSAFAVGQRMGIAQQRCTNGAVKGFAYVTGDPAVGIQNMSESYTSSPRLFSSRFDCAGAAIQVRRVHDGFQIKFNGITARSAVVSGVGVNPQTMTVTALPDGSFRITPIAPNNAPLQIGPQHQFVVVVF
jgi:hypothetical protein